MKYMGLDNNGQSIRISKIALGCARFGTKVPEKLSFEIMDKFYEGGGLCFDTARSYYEWVENGQGISERTIGRWLRNNNIRKEVIICTKGGMDRRGSKLICDISREAINSAVDSSLYAMGIDYIDLYLLHRDDFSVSVEYIVDYLNELKKSGKVRMIGVSNWTPERIKLANDYARKKNICGIQIVQSCWNIAKPTKEMWNDDSLTYVDDEAHKFYLENNIPVMAYTSQAKGFFSKAIKFGIENLDDLLKQRILNDSNYQRYLLIKKICEENGLAPEAIVLGYITSNEVNGIAIIGVSNTQQLDLALNSADYILEKKIIELFNNL